MAEYFCSSCTATPYATGDNTWTAQSSARPGKWAPYGFGTIPRDQENYYASQSNAWTQGSQVTPDNSLSPSTITTLHNFRPSKEGFSLGGQNYSSLSRAWGAQKVYTSN